MKHELMNEFTCAEDGYVIFNDRENMTKGLRKTCDTMSKWGLTMRV